MSLEILLVELALKEHLYFMRLVEGKGMKEYLEDFNLIVTKLAKWEF